MDRFRKILAGVMIIPTIGISSVAFASTYKVQSGDTFWNISNKLNISMDALMKVNNASEGTIIYVGQDIKLPGSQNAQIVKSESSNNQSANTYNYTVKPGDGLWSISNKVGMNYKSLLELNNLTANSTIYPGQSLKIDKEYKVADNNTTINNNSYKVEQNGKYGEALDWFKEVRYIIPLGTDFKVTDFRTQKTFNLRRTYGENHADVEALTAKDTEVIKEIWGGFSWTRRPVVVEVNGRKIAASLAAMPHAGNENAPKNAYTTWRSEGYGAGTNLDAIKGNNMHGHMDLHFLNSLGHANPTPNADHQRCVKEAAGIN